MSCNDPNCHLDREKKMVVIQSNSEGRATIWCDPCIADIVRALNAGGIQTVASCCGHGRRPASVVLADGQEILIMTFEEARELDERWPDINAAQLTRPEIGKVTS